LIGLGASLLAVCGASAAYLTHVSSNTIPVLAIANDVPRGALIEDSDLVIAQAASDPAIRSVPAVDRDNVVGLRAAADLIAGTLLTSAAVTSERMPPAGQTVVGVSVTEAQMPQEDLIPGDSVRIFDTPNPGDDPPPGAPRSVSATVVAVSGMTDTGHVIVDVVIDQDVAGALAARAATGRIAIVLDSAEQDEGDER
jgi:hypothetical protein